MLSVFFGAGQAFQGPAAGAIIPDLVPRHLLVQANSLSQFVRQAAFAFVGPALGGFVVHSLGAGPAFLVDAATFGVRDRRLLLLLRPRPAKAQSEGATSMRRDIAEGLRYVRQTVWLWGTLGWALAAIFLVYGPFTVLMPYPRPQRARRRRRRPRPGVRRRRAGRDPRLARRSGQIGLPRRHITFMYALWMVACLQIAAYAFAGVPWQAMAISFAGEGCWAAGLIVWVTLMQRVVPAELLGRVKSVDWLLSLGLAPLSFAVTGPLAGWLGVKPVLLIAGIGASALTVVFYFLPGMRDTETPGHTSRVILSEPAETAAAAGRGARRRTCGCPTGPVVSCGHGGNGASGGRPGLFAFKEAVSWRRSRASRERRRARRTARRS